MGVYSDFPECLPRYAWLLDQGENAFDCAGRCKACGGDVVRADHAKHLAGHHKQLAAIRNKTRNQSVARMREARKLAREAA